MKEIIAKKAQIVSEIATEIKNSQSYVVVE